MRFQLHYTVTAITVCIIGQLVTVKLTDILCLGSYTNMPFISSMPAGSRLGKARVISWGFQLGNSCQSLSLLTSGQMASSGVPRNLKICSSCCSSLSPGKSACCSRRYLQIVQGVSCYWFCQASFIPTSQQCVQRVQSSYVSTAVVFYDLELQLV